MDRMAFTFAPGEGTLFRRKEGARRGGKSSHFRKKKKEPSPTELKKEGGDVREEA